MNMALKYVSDCVKLLLKLTAILIFIFSSSSTNQCTPKKTERDGYVIRNVGIKLCQLKCVENGQCLSIEYDIETLTCRLSTAESKKIKKKEGYAILARDHSHAPTGSCISSMCSFGQRCLKTRSGKSVCVQDEKQNNPEKSPRHKVDKKETLFASSPLHDACKKGDLNRVRHILSQGLVDINSRDEKHGRTPLMVAAHGGHCEIFDFLVSKWAKMSELDNDCKNALHWACKGGHMGMVECVLPQYGINNVHMPPLIEAAWEVNKDVLEFLVCTGSNVSQVDNNGNTALHHVCISGHVAIVKFLVSQGSVDINSRNKDGLTPLMMATSNGNKDVVDFLVSMGANVSDVDDKGNTVLHFACVGGNVGMVKYIFSQCSADINRRNIDIGQTPLMIAAMHGHKDVFDFLVRIVANVSHVDDDGHNILHLASSYGRVEMVKHILSQNLVDINARGKDGRTAAMMAKRERKRNLYNLLVSLGCPVK